MTLIQRIIKYLAICFAISIIISVVSGITFAFSSITGIGFDDGFDDGFDSVKHYSISGNIDTLDIDLKATSLNIVSGEEFTFDTSSKYIEIYEEGNKLVIKEKNHSLLNNNMLQVVTITVPLGYKLYETSLEVDTGSVKVEKLVTDFFETDFEAGKVTINDLTVNRNAKIETGAGNVTINNSVFNNLSLDGGVSNITIDGIFYGNTKLDLGVGNLNMNIKDDIKDYKFIIDKSVGKVLIDGKVLEDKVYGNGVNITYIDASAGNIYITNSNN